MADCKALLPIGDGYSLGCRSSDGHAGNHRFSAEWDGDGAVTMDGWIAVDLKALRSGWPDTWDYAWGHSGPCKPGCTCVAARGLSA